MCRRDGAACVNLHDRGAPNVDVDRNIAHGQAGAVKVERRVGVRARVRAERKRRDVDRIAPLHTPNPCLRKRCVSRPHCKLRRYGAGDVIDAGHGHS